MCPEESFTFYCDGLDFSTSVPLQKTYLNVLGLAFYRLFALRLRDHGISKPDSGH